MVRNYHQTASAYALPNDSPEHVRLDHQSLALNKAIGQHFHTDVKEIATNKAMFKAVDIGCGTGIMTTSLAWEIQDLAESGSKVYGVDLSPVPDVHERPKNVEYVQGNIVELSGRDSRFQSGAFDYVFQRMVVLGVNDWLAHIKMCYSMLKSGGWIEFQEVPFRWFDRSGAETSHNWKWLSLAHAAGSKRGIDLLGPERIKQHMEEAGFVDVQERRYVWNWSTVPWDEHPDSDATGKYTMEELQPGVPSQMRKMLQMAGMDEREFSDEECLRTTSSEAKTHTKFYVVWGRKP